MTSAEHHKIMMDSLAHHLTVMPEDTCAILLSYEPKSENASVVSSMDDVTTARLLRDILALHEARN